jgi:hypothetical protein
MLKKLAGPMSLWIYIKRDISCQDTANITPSYYERKERKQKDQSKSLQD